MKIENRLLELKEELEEVQNEINRNEGRLSGLYDNLRTHLGLSEKASTKKLIDEANKKIKKLTEQNKKDEEQLQKLINEIEEEVQEWDDD